MKNLDHVDLFSSFIENLYKESERPHVEAKESTIDVQYIFKQTKK